MSQIDPEQFADLVVVCMKDAIAGPKVGGRFESLEARVAELEQRPTPIYRGTHQQGKSYLANSLTTRAGSLWIALATTTTTPGTDASWRLIVKQGKA